MEVRIVQYDLVDINYLGPSLGYYHDQHRCFQALYVLEWSTQKSRACTKVYVCLSDMHELGNIGIHDCTLMQARWHGDAGLVRVSRQEPRDLPTSKHSLGGELTPSKHFTIPQSQVGRTQEDAGTLWESTTTQNQESLQLSICASHYTSKRRETLISLSLHKDLSNLEIAIPL